MALKSLSTSTIRQNLTKSNTFNTGIVRNDLRFSIHAEKNLDSSNTIPDLSGNGYNATKTSQLTTNSLGYWDFGITPHIDKYILIPKETILGSTNWSLEFWLSADMISGRYWFHAGGSVNRHLFGPAGINNLYSTINWYMPFVTSQVIDSFVAISDSGSYQLVQNKLFISQLHHIVCTVEPNLIKMYIDGEFWFRTPLTQSDGSPFVANTQASCSTLNNSYWFGQELDTDGESAEPNPYALDRNQSFLGKLYSMRMYNKTLSDKEVSQNFRAGVAAK